MLLKKLFIYFSIFSGVGLIPAQVLAKISMQKDSINVKDNPIQNMTDEIVVMDTARFWDFNLWNDSCGWTIPEKIKGGVMGGAAWITIPQDPSELESPSWRSMVWGNNPEYDLVSPLDLAIPAARFTKIRMRIMNLSPETDGFIFWKSKEAPDVDGGQIRFAMKPDSKEWQEVICHVDGQWSGTIDQIRIRPAQMWRRGDIWIDWIAVTNGSPKPTKLRPDLISKKIVPQIEIPGISQEGFLDAFKVLDECLVTDVPMRGFNYPFLAPGGQYGQNWWQLDGSLNVAGAKWVNQNLVENIMRGFSEVQEQNPDGRIDLWGGSTIRGQVADVSSIPRFFEAAWDVARRTHNPELKGLIFTAMKKYLGYWLSSAKRDEKTGLITSVFEESLGGVQTDPGIMAPVDLNVAVAIGCKNTSHLAKQLGFIKQAKEYSHLFKELSQSINLYLWNKERKVYLNYNVRKKTHYPMLICTTFDPLQLGIAPEDRIEKLLPKLLNPKFFNWDIRPVTSIAKTDSAFVEAVGAYDGSAWYGDLWTMRNIPIIRGLQDIGKHVLAAELNWSTITTFHSNYSEYVVPSTGSGEGVKRYGWTASQYIQSIIEHLFGIDYSRFDRRLRIIPHIPKELRGKKISISNLIIPGEDKTMLSLSVEQNVNRRCTIEVSISGKLPEGDLEIFLPFESGDTVQIKDSKGEILPIVKTVEGLSNIAGIRIPISQKVSLHFLMDNR